jgi:hypothetical protein
MAQAVGQKATGGDLGWKAPLLHVHTERSFGVRQLAAAFLPASLLAGISNPRTMWRQHAGWEKAAVRRGGPLQSFAPNASGEVFFRSLFSP